MRTADYGYTALQYLNAQCWLDSENNAIADVNTFVGEHGNRLYKRLHNKVVNDWKYASQVCEVESSF